MSDNQIITITPEMRKQKVWYKVFVHRDPAMNLYPELWNKNRIIPIGKWIDEKDYREEIYKDVENPKCFTHGWTKYPIGWHCFMEREHAERWAEMTMASEIREVYVKKIKAALKWEVGTLSPHIWTVATFQKIYISLTLEEHHDVSLWIDKATDEQLEQVADRNCDVCGGHGWYEDDPSPAGVTLRPGKYSYICDCLSIWEMIKLMRGINEDETLEL